jgi:ribosomal protein L11 methyltransferase
MRLSALTAGSLQQAVFSLRVAKGTALLFFYHINDSLIVAAPWWRFLLSRAQSGILVRTGHTFPPNHPTTKMCLRFMVRYFREHRCRRLVDVGCGSGILALAGLKLGAELAVALDISPQALVTSRANAELNDLKESLLLVRGSAETLAGRFDLVLANLPMPILSENLAELVRLIGDEDSLVLSGFQDVDKYLLQKRIDELGLTAENWLSEDLTFPAVPPSGSFTWMALVARRRASESRGK